MLAKYFEPLLKLDKVRQRNVFFTALCLISLLFTYPIIKAAVDALFIDAVGASKSPHVWIYSIIGLTISVWIYNQLQNRVGVKALFLFTTVISIVIFFFCFLMFKLSPNKIWYYLMFVWREVYIILLIQKAAGFLNETLNYTAAKVVFGPIVALESVAGILGGLLTTRLTYVYSTEVILLIGASTILISGLAFFFTQKNSNVDKVDLSKVKPLESIKNIKLYVFWIALIIILSQFCINLINFKFNLALEALIPDKLLKTRYLGEINIWISTVSLVLQIVIVPIILRFFSEKMIHVLIPLSYLVLYLIGFGLGGSAIFPIALTFAYCKGCDYSVFSVIKELLYYPLNSKQKYGAKYIVDMIVYRLGKGIISVILIFFSSNLAINIMLIGFLVIWPFVLIPLFREQKNLPVIHN